MAVSVNMNIMLLHTTVIDGFHTEGKLAMAHLVPLNKAELLLTMNSKGLELMS
jgi:hypothetical protein